MKKPLFVPNVVLMSLFAYAAGAQAGTARGKRMKPARRFSGLLTTDPLHPVPTLMSVQDFLQSWHWARVLTF